MHVFLTSSCFYVHHHHQHILSLTLSHFHRHHSHHHYQANALFFPVNELVKRGLAERQGVTVDELSTRDRLIAGACAGLSYWVLTYPLDLIKGRQAAYSLDIVLFMSVGTSVKLCVIVKVLRLLRNSSDFTLIIKLTIINSCHMIIYNSTTQAQ